MDPYKVLGVSYDATPEEIKAAYRSLAKKYHPDRYTDEALKAEATEKFKKINEAYQMLTEKNEFNSHSQSTGSYNSGSNYGNYSAEYVRVENLIRNGRYDEAEAVLDAISNRNARWYYLSGHIALNKGRYSAAADFFEAAYKLEPSNLEYKTAYDRTHLNKESYTRNYSGSSYDSSCCDDDCCRTLLTIWCMQCLCQTCCNCRG